MSVKRGGPAPLSEEEAQAAIDAYAAHPTVAEAARAMGVHVNTLKYRLDVARRRKLAPRAMYAPTSGTFASGKSYEERAGRLDITDAGRWMVVSDIHVPFHDERSTDTAFDDAAKNGVTGIILAGDIMDFHSLSRFDRDPKHRDAVGEIERGREFLATLRKSFGRARIVYVEGNHESRLVAFLMRMAPELFGLAELSLPSLLNFHGNGITFADSLTRVFLGKLLVVHGHEYRLSTGVVNVARVLHQRAGVNVMCGHYHRSSEYVKRLADGTVSGAWSLGCLSGLNPRWLPLNEWNHGYSIVDLDADGGFDVHNRTIIRGKVR